MLEQLVKPAQKISVSLIVLDFSANAFEDNV